ncbi:LAFA_0D13740g1_1 [Lachancea sp. 'fantastica']|nr:LAFA_0D13740g1_1 [Lachancea sp. 'fantastica']
MGKGSARSGGFSPVNTLTDSRKPKNRTNSPSRYHHKHGIPHVQKKDMRENLEILGSNTNSYLPERSLLSHGSATIPGKKRRISGNDIEEMPRNSKAIFESLGEGRRGFTTQGTFRAIHHSGAQTKKEHAVLKVEEDEELTMKINWCGKKIEGSEVNFMTEGRAIFFSSHGGHLGVVLKCGRNISLRPKDQTQMFLWTDRYLSNFGNLRDKLVKALVKVVDVEQENVTDGDVIREMQEIITMQNNTLETKSMASLASKAHLETREQRHFENKNLRSLHKSNGKSSASGKGTIIGVPNSADFHESHTTSTNQFYGSRAPQGSLLDHSLSNTKRITRSCSETPPVTATTEELDTPYETPQLFKPTLFYKFDDSTTLSVSNQDFKCLYNHDWINDSILDFFVKYWMERSIKAGIVSRSQTQVLSSFFYTKLISKPEKYYDNVKKWVRDTDLFSKNFVVMPINESFHWFGCIICNLPALFSFLMMERDFNLKHKNDSNAESNDELSVTSPIVTIMVYDSLRQTHSREVEPIKEFLIAYAADKYNLEVFKHQIKMKTCMVPQQPNMSDCGVHVILNTKTFFDNPKRTTDLWRESKIRSKSAARTVNEYFDKKGRTNARQELRSVLLDLQKEQVERNKHNGNSNLLEQDRSATEDDSHSDLEILENYTEPLAKVENEDENASENLTFSVARNAENCHSGVLKDASADVGKEPTERTDDRSDSITSELSTRSNRSETASPNENIVSSEPSHYKRGLNNSPEFTSDIISECNTESEASSAVDKKSQVTLSSRTEDFTNLGVSHQKNTLENNEESAPTQLRPVESPFFAKKVKGESSTALNESVSMHQSFKTMNSKESLLPPENYGSDDPIEISQPISTVAETTTSTKGILDVEKTSKSSTRNSPRTLSYKFISSPSRDSSNGSKSLNSYSKSKLTAARTHEDGYAIPNQVNISDDELESFRVTGERLI